jgi:hypothetical protein
MGKKESEAAASLGRARWKKVPANERSAHAEMMLHERWKNKSEEERKAAATAAANARWSKARNAGNKGKQADKRT